ncbi:nitroreductase [Thiomicrorhabdus sp.]|uniref:nitroreductase n=1 Tax=Thiomicrorhabdus sp. TaxID=2039724 RepID=UPI0029C66FB2|nr:nitroreductase [Thiomicrorhabdus sp.]
MPLTVYSAVTQRHSVRAFLETPVEEEIIRRIIEAARHAPSGVNTQPWQVAVVSGAAKQRLQNAMLEKFQAGEHGKMDYAYYPDEWRAPYKQRRVETGKRLYGALQIERQNKEGQKAQWAANYRSFDAPVALYFFMDRSLQTGSFLDYGMFIQNVMLLAIEEGLGTCPQGALGEYPDIIRQELGYGADKLLVCGMALGYEDQEHPVNQYRTDREGVEDFTRFFD